MKRTLTISLILTSALIIGACGATPAEPTMSVQDVQSTAVSAAFTIVAETQAAIPTNTPVPPTDTPVPTPLPSDTPIPSPTLESALVPTITPAQQVSATKDPCNQLLPGSLPGPTAKIRIFNNTKFSGVKISLYLSNTDFGVCGFVYIPPFDKNQSDTYTHLIQGAYTMYAWTDDGSLNIGPAYANITGPDLTIFEIRDNTIQIAGP
ncbi:MAG TPA: hypothetical protein VIS72_09020 [Anaerolineales bacterium]